MTADERAAGVLETWKKGEGGGLRQAIAAAIRAAVEEERAACLGLVRALHDEWHRDEGYTAGTDALRVAAEAIEGRGHARAPGGAG